MIVNDMRVAMKGRLLKREDEIRRTAETGKTQAGVGGVVPLSNTPYGAGRGMVQSFLGVPCTTPPFGTIGAIDMRTKKMLWHRSIGTPEQFGPLGMKTHLPIELGMPSLGGTVPTASGLVFFSATSDYNLRALDVLRVKSCRKAHFQSVGARRHLFIFRQKMDASMLLLPRVAHAPPRTTVTTSSPLPCRNDNGGPRSGGAYHPFEWFQLLKSPSLCQAAGSLSRVRV